MSKAPGGDRLGEMTDPQARAALRKGLLFREATNEDVDEALASAVEVSFGADEAIFEEGDSRDGMFVLLDGEVEVTIGGRFHRLKAGDFFGEMALLIPDKRLAAVHAVKPVRALRISPETFESFLVDHPHVATGMLRALCLRLREVEQRLDAWMAP